MKRALMKFLAQTTERDRLVEVLLDETADRLHTVSLIVAAQRFGLAAQAGAVSGPLGLLRQREELNVLAPRAPRRARGPAVYARARHSEHELAVMCCVARNDRVPANLVGRIGP
jgi:hypothetical protein